MNFQSGSQPNLDARIVERGESEWKGLDDDRQHELDPPRARRLLGSGFAITEFLIAPAAGLTRSETVCSLGALVNLMVVSCDHSLDAGVPPTEVFAQAATVMALLRIYRQRLDQLGIDPALKAVIQRVIARMTLAETRTVTLQENLPFRDWLCKSSLPFVLMGLPSWAHRAEKFECSMKFGQHLRWLYKVGRFFGSLDDAADYHKDLASGHPNCFRSKSPEETQRQTARIANWGEEVLTEWRELVQDGPQARMLSDTFLNFTWAWLHSP